MADSESRRMVQMSVADENRSTWKTAVLRVEDNFDTAMLYMDTAFPRYPQDLNRPSKSIIADKLEFRYRKIDQTDVGSKNYR